MTLLAKPLIDYLRQLEAQGQTYVNVDDGARLLLREFYRRAQAGGAPVAGRVASQPQVASVPPVSEAPVSKTEHCVEVSAGSADEKIANLKVQAANWPQAKSVGSFRDTMVFSAGNVRADIMLVGEAPGFDEERFGEPFSGKAGQKLDAILKAMGTSREQVYISNIVKFRPKMANQTTSNRKPTAEELAVWLPFIKEEVKVVAPKVIVALGGTAAQALLGKTLSVEGMRGKFHQYEGVDLRVTFHPSYILDEGVTPEKRMLWLDMLSVMERLGMPITEKQRGYFAKK